MITYCVHERIPKENIIVIDHNRDLSKFYPCAGDVIQKDNRCWNPVDREWKQKDGERWKSLHEWLVVLWVVKEVHNYYIISCIKTTEVVGY
jgi:hypothetical protein